MIATYQKLKEAFLSFFQKKLKNDAESPLQYHEGENWIYVRVASAGMDSIHYELIKRGVEFFIELHVKVPSRNVPQWQKLRAALDGDQRHFFHFTYYSSNYWRCRNPVVVVEDISKDLARLCDIVEPVFATKSEGNVELQKSTPPTEEALPFQRNLEEVAAMLDAGTLHLPAVQRGKVWNAARIATLWDSIFRGFSIGAFCVQQMKNGRGYDLLDGQQRSNAISLAYDSFPPEPGRERTSVLWIDIGPKQDALASQQRKFVFHATTPSQPWGYGDSSDETKNALLSSAQKRAAIGMLDACSPPLQWHDGTEKPYPGELFPYNSGCAVPFPLLREFLEGRGDFVPENAPSFSGFLEWCAQKRQAARGTENSGRWWNWLDVLQSRKDGVDPWLWDEIIFAENADRRLGRIAQLREYCIAFLDAGSVTDDEIAVYFTRIGRGGVRPSDEELAYSVLKAHLKEGFREKIEQLHEDLGLAQPSRIAHLALRCFRSARTEEGKTTFCSSSVLEEAIKMCKTSESGDMESGASRAHGRDGFLDFVCKGAFDELLAKVQTAVFTPPGGLTHWHRTRFCQYSNGDIFLFLLLAVRDNAVESGLLAATAEWLYEKASHPAQTIRFILSEGLWEGVAHAMRQTYYGASRLPVPVHPRVIQKVADLAQSEVDSNDFPGNAKRWADEAGIADFIASGYNSQRAYGMLLYACQSKANNFFDYDSNLGVWAEDNCPWDYDHILPRSWIDGMSGKNAGICQWLENSLGNLAPLPFEMNRSLSDKERDHLYPYCGDPGREKDALQIQHDYCLDGNALEATRGFADSPKAQRAFIESTLVRFSKIYQKWYFGLSFDRLLRFDFENAQETDGVARRRRVLSALAEMKELPERSFMYYSTDGKRRIVGTLHECDADWFAWDWISVFKQTDDCAVELSIDRQCRNCEMGIPRLTIGDGEILDGMGQGRFSKLDREKWEMPEKDRYWHIVHREAIPETMTVEEAVALLSGKLLELLELLPKPEILSIL